MPLLDTLRHVSMVAQYEIGAQIGELACAVAVLQEWMEREFVAPVQMDDEKIDLRARSTNQLRELLIGLHATVRAVGGRKGHEMIIAGPEKADTKAVGFAHHERRRGPVLTNPTGAD